MTLLEKFKKDYPNTSTFNSGRPKCCPSDVGYTDKPDDCLGITCTECWNREYKGEDNPVENVEASTDENKEYEEMRSNVDSDEKIEVIDEDHIWVGNKQFVSLRRFQEAVSEAKDETHGLDEVKTKLTITLELHELNNFTLASKIFEICQNDNIHYLDAQTVARMLEAEAHNERRKKER